MEQANSSIEPPRALDVAAYDALLPQISDCIEFSPGFRHRRRVIRRWCRGFEYRSLLDVGCGTATLIKALRRDRPSARFAAVDLSPDVVALNRATVEGVQFDVLDIERGVLPELFDLVVCSEVIEHLANRPAALSNLARMLNPGGRLLLTFPTGKVLLTDRYMGHTTHPCPEEVFAFGRANGLSVERFCAWGWPGYSLFRWASNLNADWTIGAFARGHYGRGTRIFSDVAYAVAYLSSSVRGPQIFLCLRNEGAK